MYAVAPFSAGYVFKWNRECARIMGQKTNYLGMKMSKTTGNVLKLEEEGLLAYDEDFHQYVEMIENDEDYVAKVVAESERRMERK